ncbi:MAG: cytidine deaminase [Candidatus Puniceispirillales bacterium]
MMNQDILIQAAITAMPRAYAPYSQFMVGAAICDENGDIHTGVNVENAAYPQGSCAEAGAIAAMIMAGGTRIASIAVAGRGDMLCTPCGGCRQRIREFANPDTPILIADTTGLRQRFTLADLLPHSFGPDHLA